MFDLTVSAPKQVGDLMFYSVLYHGRPYELSLSGKIASPLRTYDNTHSVYVELDNTIPVLDLESLSKDTLDEYDIEPRSIVNEHKEVSIKLKKVDDKWVFTTNTTLNETSLVIGAPVTLTVRPGFYANDKTQQGGLFLTLKNLTFEEPAKKRRVKKE